MKYTDSHLTHTTANARHLETGRVHPDVNSDEEAFAIQVSKDLVNMGMPAWLDIPAAAVLRNELNAFIGDEAPHDPTQITLTVPEGDFEVQTIAAMLTLLNRHDGTTQMRILSYLMDRRTEAPS